MTDRILLKKKILEETLIFRYPRLSDLKDLLNLINSLIQEQVDIAKTTKMTLAREKVWLVNTIDAIKKKEKITIIAELDGVCVGSCEITRDTFDVSRHVGTLGIGIIKEARRIGIGTDLVKICLKESKKQLGLKLVKLYVFDTNKVGRNLYEEIGFKEIGRIPNGVYHNKKYKDDIIMAKKL